MAGHHQDHSLAQGTQLLIERAQLVGEPPCRRGGRNDGQSDLRADQQQRRAESRNGGDQFVNVGRYAAACPSLAPIRS